MTPLTYHACFTQCFLRSLQLVTWSADDNGDSGRLGSRPRYLYTTRYGDGMFNSDTVDGDAVRTGGQRDEADGRDY